MAVKSKSLHRIEQKLQSLDETSYRYQVLDACRKFKTTWMELGQSLYGVHRDRLYEEWGYVTFDNYCSQELGIKKATALKLLKSYRFLESEEPEYIQQSKNTKEDGHYPDLDSVNLLRIAKNSKNIDDKDYEKIRGKVLDEAKEPQEVRQQVRLVQERNQMKDPDQARAERRFKFLKGLVSKLEQVRLEAMANRFLPAKLLEELEEISHRVEREINRD